MNAGDQALGVVATTSKYYNDMVEDGLCLLGRPTSGGGGLPRWEDLQDLSAVLLAMKFVGFEPEAETAWEKLGIHTDCAPPTHDVILQRRTLLESIASAKDAHKWTRQDDLDGLSRVSNILGDACTQCHTLLPDLLKKMGRKKRNACSGPATWMEPSSLVFEYSLTLHPSLTIALHLSDLQRMNPAAQQLSASETGQPRVLALNDSRELYNRLGQSQEKIEEALSIFQKGGIVIWAPDNHDQLPRIVSALRRIYTNKGICVQLTMLVPYMPLPGCESSETIMDLWTHPLLHNKNKDMVSNVTFIREASRCVFTRDSTPVHHVKNIAAVTIRADGGQGTNTEYCLRAMLVDNFTNATQILVDVPAGSANDVWLKLNATCGPTTAFQLEWKLQRRSRGSKPGLARNLLVGYSKCIAIAEVRAVIKFVIGTVGGGDVFVGHSGMFADKTNIILDADIKHITALLPLAESCVLVTPSKALIVPGRPAREFSDALSGSEELMTVSIRYRKSGDMRGEVFARPQALQNQIRAAQHNKRAQRLPGSEAALQQNQIVIEVLSIEGRNHQDLAQKIMNRVGQEMGISYRESQDESGSLGAGEWRAGCSQGEWEGRILVQCSSPQEVSNVHSKTNGRGICVDGTTRTLEVTSPSNTFLGSDVLNAQCAARSAAAAS